MAGIVPARANARRPRRVDIIAICDTSRETAPVRGRNDPCLEHAQKKSRAVNSITIRVMWVTN
jgi:hypothetical protein